MNWENGTKATQERPKGVKIMIKGDTPRKLDAQEAYVRAENVKEWIARFAETGDGNDYDKMVAKYKELGQMIDGLEQWTTIV